MIAAGVAVALAAFGETLAVLVLIALLVADVVVQLVLEIRREQPWDQRERPLEQPP